jgi:hypothetical protein
MEWFVMHLEGIADLGTSTFVALALICSVAIYFMRDYLANILTVLLILPVMFGVAVLCTYVCLFYGFFDPKKMADWIVSTIMSGAVGALSGIATAAVCARAWDRAPSHELRHAGK